MNDNNSQSGSNQSTKRKRDEADTQPQPPRVHNIQTTTPPATGSHIRYLIKPNGTKTRLVEGNADTCGDILTLIDEYEGALSRSESLAATLGAKLVGPLLLKSFDKLFDGPINILQCPYGVDASNVTWLDIVEYASSRPRDFVLNNERVAQFWVKHCHVQISEDDFRLIMSGAPERMIPVQPIPEDEAAELGTIEILEQRLTSIIKKADLVAGRARQLNYHLKGRKAALYSRQSISLVNSDAPITPQPGSTFHAVNAQTSTANADQRHLHNDLLRQFLADDDRQTPPVSRSKHSKSSSDAVYTVAIPQAQYNHDIARRGSHATLHEDGSGGPYRALMTAKVDKLGRGDLIQPSCDRCKRIGIDCTKHLTACSGCTRKHAKCSWKELTLDEVAYLNSEMSEEQPSGDATSALELASTQQTMPPDSTLAAHDPSRLGESALFGTPERGVMMARGTYNGFATQARNDTAANHNSSPPSAESTLTKMAAAAAETEVSR